jgi:type III pantothenate kinase
VIDFVADLGNSRLKWAKVEPHGLLAEQVALPLERVAWEHAWKSSASVCEHPSRWAIASVNPPVAAEFASFLAERGVRTTIWYTAASEIPIAANVEGAETGGADRALAVYAAVDRMPSGRPGLVVMCGTAITVERISAEGTWEGGAIAPGLGTIARALHLRTAQLPLIDTRHFDPEQPPPAWGPGTISSLTAGVFWGTVGMVRELIARQRQDIGGEPWVVWAGGDARLLARYAGGAEPAIVPDLVLKGLARLARF